MRHGKAEANIGKTKNTNSTTKRKSRRLAMAKKTTRKSSEELSETPAAAVATEVMEEAVPAAEEPAPTKVKARLVEEASSGSTVGIGDIRKAVAFVNSVGGLDKALNLLQILKVAREVQ